VSALSYSEGVGTVEHAVAFPLWNPKQLQDRVAFLASRKTLGAGVSKEPGRNSVSLSDIRSISQSVREPNANEQVPERAVVSNYKSEHIPTGHYTLLEYCIAGMEATSIFKRTFCRSFQRLTISYIPITKLVFKMVNVPLPKTKTITEDWTKMWKQLNGIFLGDFTSKLYLQQIVSVVYDTLLSSEKLTSITKTKCVVNPKVGQSFSVGIPGRIMLISIAVR
jgi:hypothetical protein